MIPTEDNGRLGTLLSYYFILNAEKQKILKVEHWWSDKEEGREATTTEIRKKKMIQTVLFWKSESSSLQRWFHLCCQTDSGRPAQQQLMISCHKCSASPTKYQHAAPWRCVSWSSSFRFPFKPFLTSLQSCSWKGNPLIKTSESIFFDSGFRTNVVSASLTAATCDPASTSASISARHLYCCGDSITISLLGAFPARPCMLIRLACWSGVNPHCMRTAMAPQSVNGERALLSLRYDPLTIDPSLLPLCLIRRMGPLPPSQLCSCAAVECVEDFFFHVQYRT